MSFLEFLINNQDTLYYKLLLVFLAIHSIVI